MKTIYIDNKKKKYSFDLDEDTIIYHFSIDNSNDIVINRPLDFLVAGTVICLDGHTLKIDDGLNVLNIVSGKDITFTDCKGTGAITRSTNTSSVVSNAMFEVSGELYMYNINVADINIAAANPKNFIKANNNSKVYLENVKINGIANASDRAVIDVDSAKVYSPYSGIKKIKSK